MRSARTNTQGGRPRKRWIQFPGDATFTSVSLRQLQSPSPKAGNLREIYLQLDKNEKVFCVHRACEWVSLFVCLLYLERLSAFRASSNIISANDDSSLRWKGRKVRRKLFPSPLGQRRKRHDIIISEIILHRFFTSGEMKSFSIKSRKGTFSPALAYSLERATLRTHFALISGIASGTVSKSCRGV